jgi:hypothetical protein
MKISDLKSGLVSLGGALVGSLCCLLPLTLVLLGVGGGAFMMTTVRFRPLFLPLGLLGVGAGYYLYFREKRRCDALGCRMAGPTLNLALLIIATAMLVVEVTFILFPDILWGLMTEG